jgi:hypothetical protein
MPLTDLILPNIQQTAVSLLAWILGKLTPQREHWFSYLAKLNHLLSYKIRRSVHRSSALVSNEAIYCHTQAKKHLRIEEPLCP